MTKIINCHVHDHFEIACMQQAVVKLSTHDGNTVEGIAKDLSSRDGVECLHVQVDGGLQLINLLSIKTLGLLDGAVIRVSSKP